MTAWLYLIGNADLPMTIKIGITNKLTRRLTEISTGNPEKLSILHKWFFSTMDEARSLERKSHARLSYCRLNGEWFSVDLKTAIDSINNIINEPETTQLEENERILRVAELKSQIQAKRDTGKLLSQQMSELRKQLDAVQTEWEENLKSEGILYDELKFIDY